MADDLNNNNIDEVAKKPSADELRTHYGDDTPIEPRWYVVHTYSGYENKVKEDLEKTIENRGLQDLILEVKYPTETVTEVREVASRSKSGRSSRNDEYEEVSDDGVKGGGRKSKVTKTVVRKVYPGYVMVKMVMTDRTWYVVRNTRGVTGFVGPGSKPIPLTDEEVTAMGVERMHLKINIEVGESVRVVSGPFENFIGVVQSVDPEAQRVKLLMSLFGKDTPMELDFIEVQKL